MLKTKYTFRVRFIIIHGVAKSVFQFLYDFSYFWLIFQILRVGWPLVYPVLVKSLCWEGKPGPRVPLSLPFCLCLHCWSSFQFPVSLQGSFRVTYLFCDRSV